MTGKGQGCCILKLPNTPDEPVTGFVGESGRHIRLFARNDGFTTEMAESEECPHLPKKDPH
jgi:hypothetical protein